MKKTHNRCFRNDKVSLTKNYTVHLKERDRFMFAHIEVNSGQRSVKCFKIAIQNRSLRNTY